MSRQAKVFTCLAVLQSQTLTARALACSQNVSYKRYEKVMTSSDINDKFNKWADRRSQQ